jgi:hypothetical protein
MKAIFLNKYFDGTYNYYDLSFEEEELVLMRLNGVIFNISYTDQDKIDRAKEIATENLPEYELVEIITN